MDHILDVEVDRRETLGQQQEIKKEGDEEHEVVIKAKEDLVIEVNEQPEQVI